MIKGEIKADKIVIININNQNAISFPVLDTFIKVAAHLSRNGSLEVIGKATNEIRELVELKPVVNAKVDQIVGSVIYVDNYGNVITNITRKLFNEVGKSRKYTILLGMLNSKGNETYSDAIDFTIPKEKREEDGKKIALFNDAEHLELAIYKSNPLSVGST